MFHIKNEAIIASSIKIHHIHMGHLIVYATYLVYVVTTLQTLGNHYVSKQQPYSIKESLAKKNTAEHCLGMNDCFSQAIRSSFHSIDNHFSSFVLLIEGVQSLLLTNDVLLGANKHCLQLHTHQQHNYVIV